jgi:integrase
MRRPPKYTRGFVDRHGKPRWYFRREGFQGRALPGLPWSPEFMAAYEDAMNGESNPRPAVGSSRTLPGTFDALIVSFYGSTVFRGWSAETQRTRRSVYERFRAATMPGARANNGRCRVAHLLPKHADAMIAAMLHTPFGARNFKKAMRSLMRYAITQRLRKDDPFAGIKFAKIKTDGYASWGEEQIAAFEKHHPIGTKPRMAMALLLFTAQRRGDVIAMGPQHERGDMIAVRQQKTGATLLIPIHPELRQILDKTPCRHLTYLTTSFGKPFTSAGFGNVFREWCEAAGLPKGFSAHGLRKAACRRLAEAGCSASQIMSVSGHASLTEAEKYVRAANQQKLARAAMATAYPEAGIGTQIGKPASRFAKKEKKP